MEKVNFDKHEHLSQIIIDAYSMISSSICLKENNASNKSLTITSCLPRAGKTSISINLAICLSDYGFKTLLVDADLRKKSNELLKNNKIGLVDYFKNDKKFSDIVCKTNYKNLSYIAAGSTCKNPMAVLCPKNIDLFLEQAKELYDFIIFDTPPMASVTDAACIAAKTDMTLLVVEIGTTKSDTLKKTKEHLLNVNANISGVILNKAKKGLYKKFFHSFNYFKEKESV